MRFQCNISLLLENGGSSVRGRCRARRWHEAHCFAGEATAGLVEKVVAGHSGGEGEPRTGEGYEAEWGTRWRRPQQVAFVDEVGATATMSQRAGGC
jgi:hypothetical protein